MNILLADDHKMIVDGIKALLKDLSGLQVVAEASSGKQVLEILRGGAIDIDLIILDLNMPNIDGVESTRQIRLISPQTKILILTMHDRVSLIKQLVELGVNGYILKNTGCEELIQAVRTIEAGKDFFSQDVTSILVKALKNPISSFDIKLTKREIEILSLLSQAYTTSEIAERLFLSPYTVDTHRKNLLGKLGLKNTPALVKYALENDIISLRSI